MDSEIPAEGTEMRVAESTEEYDGETFTVIEMADETAEEYKFDRTNLARYWHNTHGVTVNGDSPVVLVETDNEWYYHVPLEALEEV